MESMSEIQLKVAALVDAHLTPRAAASATPNSVSWPTPGVLAGPSSGGMSASATHNDARRSFDSSGIERGIVRQIVDDVKTEGSRRTFVIADELLKVLKRWKQATPFSAAQDWVFASPLKVGRLPYSYTGVWRELQRAASAAGIGHLGTHAFRHTYRSWLDAVGTPIAVQQNVDAPFGH